MFDCEVAELDAEAAADAIAQAHRLRVRLEGRLLELAAHWADLHDHPRLRGWRAVPGGERLRRPGGEGTPEVIDFSAADLGALQETTSGAGWSMMADALDLRHRLPRLWAAVLAGRVRTWKARHIAQATRHLDPAAVDRVDAALDGLVPALPWIRCQSVLAAAIMAADPQAAEAWAAAEEARRFVRAGRTDEHGLKLLIAKATAGEVIWFLAMVDRIADILAADGDPDPVDVRRSKAIGILAQPAVALDLLTRHHDDPSTNPAPAADPN